MDIEKLLTVDMCKKHIVINDLESNLTGKAPFPLVGRTITLVDSTPKSTKWIRPSWTNLPPSHLKGMSHFITCNPDPDIDGYQNTSRWINSRFIKLMETLSIKNIIEKCLIVHEYGNGKVHLHGFVKCKMACLVTKEINKVFNHRINLKHRTTRLNYIKSVKDRNNMLEYLKKEPHNKHKYLYKN